MVGQYLLFRRDTVTTKWVCVGVRVWLRKNSRIDFEIYVYDAVDFLCVYLFGGARAIHSCARLPQIEERGRDPALLRSLFVLTRNGNNPVKRNQQLVVKARG